MEGEKSRVIFQNNSNYQIGAVTYQVAAFFDAEKPPLQDKLKHLLSAEIKNNPNRTFADGQGGNVKY